MNCKVSHQLYVNKSLSLWNNFHSSRLPGRIFVCSDNFLVMQTKHSMLVRNKACRQYLNIPVFVGEPSEYSILDILLGRTIYVIKTLQLPSPAKSCSRVLVATYYQLVIIHKNCWPAPPSTNTRHTSPLQWPATPDFLPSQLRWDGSENGNGVGQRAPAVSHYCSDCSTAGSHLSSYKLQSRWPHLFLVTGGSGLDVADTVRDRGRT